MADIWLDVLTVLVLLIIGGLFTATELALVSLRPGELDELRRRGRRGARVAVLAREPTRFLGAVQIGSIVAGFFAAAYATATLAEPLGDALTRWGLGETGGESIAVVIVTLTTTFLALVLAELTPRRYAMQRPLPVASTLGPPVDRLASLLRPVLWLLEKCTNGALRLLRADPRASRSEMSVEEVRELVLAHEGLPGQEKGIIRQVFAARDRSIRQCMVPRANIDFLAAGMTVRQARRSAWEHTHTRYPVSDDQGRVGGFLHVRDLFAPNLEPGDPIGTLTRPITAYPPNKKLLAVLGEMQSGGAQIAAVVDEYGSVMGMVTLEDVVEELVGEMYDEYDRIPRPAAEPAESDRVVDGLTSLTDFARQEGFELPAGRYDTVGGYLLAALDRTPREGDSVEVAGHRLSVVSVDGWRVGQVAVRSLTSG